MMMAEQEMATRLTCAHTMCFFQGYMRYTIKIHLGGLR